MNATSLEPTSLRTTVFEKYQKVSDLHPLVVARIVCEWARIDSMFPMRFWGNDQLGTHAGLGNDRWYVGRDDKQAEMVLQITLDKEVLGRGEGQFTWRLPVSDLHLRGCNAELIPV